MKDGFFIGDETAVITTKEGDSMVMKSRSVWRFSDAGRITRGIYSDHSVSKTRVFKQGNVCE